MQLISIEIKNYRCIQILSFPISVLKDKSRTFGLIGVNEVGKTSFLKALALAEPGNTPINAKDFYEKEVEIQVTLNYELDEQTQKEIKQLIGEIDPEAAIQDAHLKQTSFYLRVSKSNPEARSMSLDGKNFNNLLSIESENKVLEILRPKLHKSIFWTAEDRFLISKPINIVEFAANPVQVSVPLKNCFNLSGISDSEINQRIQDLTGDSTEVEALQNLLGRCVSNHIRSVWPNHPIEITFIISDGLINFHINDIGADAKAKTADQRSEGFKQFISFLLTISAESRNGQLSNTILLLDEPETHLHPQAQEYLLDELIKISQDNNNIVFFATHSNYMIDKSDLSRNFRVEKLKNESSIKQFDSKKSTYASVGYEVFGILSSDYHNELYGKLHYDFLEAHPDASNGIKHFDSNFLVGTHKLPIAKPWEDGEKNSITLPTYVRNRTHHPKNGNLPSDDDLGKSIKILRKISGVEG